MQYLIIFHKIIQSELILDVVQSLVRGKKIEGPGAIKGKFLYLSVARVYESSIQPEMLRS